jgi:hypothetical protein
VLRIKTSIHRLTEAIIEMRVTLALAVHDSWKVNVCLHFSYAVH